MSGPGMAPPSFKPSMPVQQPSPAPVGQASSGGNYSSPYNPSMNTPSPDKPAAAAGGLGGGGGLGGLSSIPMMDFGVDDGEQK
mmetsp:Transcript_36945/g.56579  ORF Transcript_36945/g.56579 Transcript_36945/m.56579 type:complete len:83 (-) Transcript_36945:109-357(-)